MTPLSYADLFGITFEREYEEEILPGDLVRMGSNFHPFFEVIAVRGDKVWVRNIDTDADHISPLNYCRKLSARAIGSATTAPSGDCARTVKAQSELEACA
jgi:hypothetical protein